MKVLVSKGVTNPKGKSFEVSWEEFKDLVQQHNQARSDESADEKKLAPWFSTAEYRSNHRSRENLVGKVWAVAVDLDSIRDEAAVEKVLARWTYIAWTTWRSTPTEPRWRIVLPIEGGISPDRFPALANRVLLPLMSLAKVDPRSAFPEQLWFLPWHRRSQAPNHTIWTNTGSWIKDTQVIQVDFTGVKLATKPEEVDAGSRNSTLVLRLSEADALRCASRDELLAIAYEWNDRLRDPMNRKEVSNLVRKKWNWMQRGEGLVQRAEAWRGRLGTQDVPEIGVGLLSNDIKSAKLPPSILGDFLYPGATLITAKMKEGKSFLAMQMAMSVATGTPFLANKMHPGFNVRQKQRAVIIAGEDTAGEIAARFLGSIASGHLPQLIQADDVQVVFNDDLDRVRKSQPKVPGLALFETLVDRWYSRGYRVLALDPLRVVEAALGIDDYPGVTRGMNAHARDFLTMRYYTKVAQQYGDLCILVSMHHGKNKRDHDASDPGDMIAGTTGFGAGAIATISLLPVDEKLGAEEDGRGMIAKRRELYLHGRHTREQRLLIEQDTSTGIWRALGNVSDELMGKERQRYFEILLSLNGNTRWVSAEEIAKAAGRTKGGTVHKVLSRARRQGSTYLGWKLLVKRGAAGGYRLSENVGMSVRERES